MQEPFVYLGQIVYLVNGVSCPHCLGYHEYAPVGRFAQSLIHISDLQFLVTDEPVGALTYHPETFLYSLFKAAAYGHHFSDTLHAGPDLAGNTVEFGKIPARYLADNVVKRRLEESRGHFRDGVLQIEQPVSQPELGRHKSQRITCRL